MFPITRLRRYRSSKTLLSIFTETEVTIRNLAYPVFVHNKKTEEISSMPGQKRYNCEDLLREVENLRKGGLKFFLIFGIPDKRDAFGSSAWDENGIVQKTVAMLKREFPDVVIATDVCLCAYTDHGHCGLVKDGKILNDETLEVLSKTALSHAKAGADIIAPSDMMDGRVGAIRKALDSNSFSDVIIMSYASKFASSLYGPFREAAHSSPSFGDRSSYQMNPANFREAMLEIQNDIEEGADIIMVKPAIFYLDVIRGARERFNVPIAAYNVSGEYSMLVAASRFEWLELKKVAMEMLLSIKRAGADIIITYFAKDFINWI